MEPTTLDIVTHLGIAILAVFIALAGIYVGTRIFTNDMDMPYFLLLAGLICGVVSVIASCWYGLATTSPGLFLAALLIGVSIGLSAERRS